MGEQGFLCMDVPEEYGGIGLDYTFSALVIERARYAGIDFGFGTGGSVASGRKKNIQDDIG